MIIDPITHEELVNEAQAICGLAFTLQAALESPSRSDHFTAAACILSDKINTFVEQLKALGGEGGTV